MHISTLFMPSILFEFRGGGNRENLAPLMHLKSVRHKTIYNQYLVHLITVFHSSFSSFCSPSEGHFLGLLTSGKNEFLLIVTCDRCCILFIYLLLFKSRSEDGISWIKVNNKRQVIIKCTKCMS